MRAGTSASKIEEFGIGIRPEKTIRGAPAYNKKDVDLLVVRLIQCDDYFFSRTKQMTSDANQAIEKTEKVMEEFSSTLDKFTAVEKKFAEESKRAAGSVRDAGEKLAQGLAKVEKAANFDRLEKYVNLLERAASAMNALAELESSGRLEKIAGAIR